MKGPKWGTKEDQMTIYGLILLQIWALKSSILETQMAETLLGGGLGGWWDLDDAYLHSTISWERTCPLAQRLTPPVHSAKPISKPTATVPVLFQWYILSTNDQVQTFETRCSISLIRNPMWLPQE
ncbi:hypothetical protein CHUAL_013632 [Chamberlinius hualienensis]